jgi:hypothetical protein
MPMQLRSLLWIVALGLGALQALAQRHTINFDGISYLDMGDALWRGDWSTAINAYWSPLYAGLLGLSMRLLQPSPYWELAVAHVVNFLVFVWALGCFDFFLRQLIRDQHKQATRYPNAGYGALPEWAWLLLGYTLFLWSALRWTGLVTLTPDLCVAGFFSLALGLLFRLREGTASWLTWTIFGVVLGLGYLAKAHMLPLAFVFLAVALFTVGNLRRALPRVLLAALLFALTAGPYVVALSTAKGRLTFGDSGRLAYTWYVNKTTSRHHWQGEDPHSGSPRHPTRKLLDQPPLYEFGAPVGGTYPLWYDPSYWYEGVKLHVDLGQQLKAMMLNLDVYYTMLFDLHGSVIIGLFILFYMALHQRGWTVGKDVLQYWFLLVPALAYLGMYVLVFIQTRYVGTVFVLLLLGCFAGLRLTDTQESRRLVTCIISVIVAMFVMATGREFTSMAYATARTVLTGRDAAPHVSWQMAEVLRGMGIAPGDQVASVGHANDPPAGWARLAKVKIIAEIYSTAVSRLDIRPGVEKDFWAAADAVRQRTMAAFASAGAKAVVVWEPPSWAPKDGWQPVGDTGYYVYLFPRQAHRLLPGQQAFTSGGILP